jgi:hypothetical protein
MEMGATNSRYLPDVARVMPIVTTCLSNAQRFPLCVRLSNAGSVGGLPTVRPSDLGDRYVDRVASASNRWEVFCP